MRAAQPKLGRRSSDKSTTEAAIKALESDGIRAIFERALRDAANRGRELGDLFAKG